MSKRTIYSLTQELVVIDLNVSYLRTAWRSIRLARQIEMKTLTKAVCNEKL
jgi:CO dehydrogenase nickel-insertion accessory protein CooC1